MAASERKETKGIDTTKHFKIWFSKNPDLWMPLQNRLRLIRHHEKNPDHTLFLIGANRFLSAKAIAEQKEFCEKNNIIYLDIDNDIPRLIRESHLNKQGKDFILLQLANDQLDAFFNVKKENLPPVGNLAAASDALRWLSSLMNLGIYSDLDTEIDFKSIPKIIDHDFLIPCRNTWDGLEVNNNFIAVSKDETLPDRIRDELIESSKNMGELYLYSSPLRWVANLYGPIPVGSAIEKHFPNLTPEQIVSKISVNTTLLFKDSRTHLHGAGDVSWATDSQEKKTESFLAAGQKIANFWKKSKAKKQESEKENKKENEHSATPPPKHK